MKAIFLVLLWMQQAVYGQPAPEYQPYFSAVVVEDFDTSAAWYQSVFGLEVKTEMNDPRHAKIKILESSNYLLEILELKGSLKREELLKGKPNGTELQGQFKIGFNVSNVDAWLKHLKNLGIERRYGLIQKPERKILS